MNALFPRRRASRVTVVMNTAQKQCGMCTPCMCRVHVNANNSQDAIGTGKVGDDVELCGSPTAGQTLDRQEEPASLEHLFTPAGSHLSLWCDCPLVESSTNT